MKPLYLNEIKRVIGLPLSPNNPLIKNVYKNVRFLNNDTVVFHLNKTREIKKHKLKKYQNYYIITDQPILKEWKEYIDHFIFVPNIYHAYQRFIDYYRSLFNIPVIAITGTNGKSTVKEMITQILMHNYNVVYNKRSRNNIAYNHEHLMMIDDTTHYAVLETAVGAPGELITSCTMFKPTIGIITNIGIDHLSGCKTPQNYLLAKGELLAGLNYRGILIINGDDENINKLDLSVFRGKIIKFGLANHNDYYAKNITYKEYGMNFTLVTKRRSYEVYVPGLGEHNVLNALSSLAAIDCLGISLSEAIKHLKSFKHLRSHLSIHKGINNCLLIDDTWHINLKGTEAALKVIKAIGKDKQKIVVFGRFDDYDENLDYYDMVTNWILDAKVDYFISIDTNIRELGLKLVKKGFPSSNHIYCSSRDKLLDTLKKICDNNTIVLLKEAMYDKKLKQLLPQLIIKN